LRGAGLDVDGDDVTVEPQENGFIVRSKNPPAY